MPTILDVKPLLVAYLRKPGNGAAGSLHIYIEDGNWGLNSIRHCREWAIERGDVDAIPICDMLLRMSKTQRVKIYGRYFQWVMEADLRDKGFYIPSRRMVERGELGRLWARYCR